MATSINETIFAELAALEQGLLEIAAGNAVDPVAELCRNINEIKNQFRHYPPTSFSYEFLSKATDVLTVITDLRSCKEPYYIQHKSQLFPPFNKILKILKTHIYQHNYIKDRLNDNIVSYPATGSTTERISQLQEQIDAAMANAVAASNLAEQTNKDAMQWLSNTENLAVKETKPETAIDIGLLMLLNNAAAAIAADEVAVAMAELEDILTNQAKPGIE